MTKSEMPSSAELDRVLIEAISALGGSATNQQIYSWVVTNLKLSQSQLSVMRSGNRSEIEYRLAWARTRASKKGTIHRSGPSQWSIGSMP